MPTIWREAGRRGEGACPANTKPVVGFRLHDGAVQWLKGWALALRDEAVKRKAVEKARRVKHCRI